MAGAMANDATRAVAEDVFQQVVGFSGFGFPKAHSAAFGLLAYQSSWLRLYYGAADTCLGLITARIADILDWLRSQPSTPSDFARD